MPAAPAAVPELAVGGLHGRTAAAGLFAADAKSVPISCARAERRWHDDKHRFRRPTACRCSRCRWLSPRLRLLGFVTLTDGTKVAVMSIGSDLTMTRVGETLAGRFRVARIDEDAVELIDAVGERPVRLALP